ncbi:MAG: CDP-diacylglycerol--glycerol-3-phosphate 3-phosphatidyltransferase [Holosporales bacterium]|jgi:cardiolipin synthase|nr:CDP-diacylglycerol--glycerol-3-phosphate 3-phosphatidyltransferase [Holosporales bacterium]
MQLSIPNILTLARMGAVPFVVACFYWNSPWASVAEITLFLLACVTDFFDGYIARQQEQVSEFGRIFDPIADKLLISAILLMLAGTHVLSKLSLIPTAIILCREVLVSGLRESLSQNTDALLVTNYAKWKTASQMVSISVLLVAHALPNWMILSLLGQIGIWITALLTLVTGVRYFKKALALMQ